MKHLNIEFFKTIIDCVGIGILITDSTWNIIYINAHGKNEIFPHLHQIKGRKIQELMEDFSMVHFNRSSESENLKSDTSRTAGMRDFYLYGSKQRVRLEHQLLRIDEEDYHLLILKEKPKEKTTSVIQKEYEEKISKILTTLRKEKELNDLKSSFVSLASHEFKTPLSTILSSASLLSRYTLTQEQGRRDKHIDRIKAAVQHLNGILNEFLSISKIEQGSFNINYRNFDLKALVQDILYDLKHILKPGQRFQYKHNGTALMSLDIEVMRTVLLNLVNNAIRFSPEGTVIRINTSIRADGVTISIKDEGYGIPPADLPHIFDLFHRGENATNIEGTGLGLHIVNKYVQLMGGTIKIRSELGVGTEIILNFK